MNKRVRPENMEARSVGLRATLATFPGEGHLTRINDILRNIMEAERRIAQG